jgi:hypothetical protein
VGSTPAHPGHLPALSWRIGLAGDPASRLAEDLAQRGGHLGCLVAKSDER